jgi:hypothetical protein
VVVVKALYSASTEDLLTIGCFFDFQDTRESLRKTEKPVTLLLVSMQPPQSLLEYAFKCKSESALRNKR